MDHQTAGMIFVVCLALVGGSSIVLGHGVRSTQGLADRIAFLLFVALCPFLMLVVCALLGALNDVPPTPVSIVWLFVVTPLFAACTLIGAYVTWAYVLSWLVNGCDLIRGKQTQSSSGKDEVRGRNGNVGHDHPQNDG